MNEMKTGFALLAVALSSLAALADVSFSNADVSLSFDGRGCVSSIRERRTGRELIGDRSPFVSAVTADGRTIAPVSCVADGSDGIAFVFPDGVGTVKLRLTPFSGGWTFESEAGDLKGVEFLTLGRIAPLCNRDKGSLSNIVMDDRSAVALRSYTVELEMALPSQEVHSEIAVNDGVTMVGVSRRFGFGGKRFGLAAGAADRILPMMREMAKAAGMNHTGCGGPNSLSSDANRCSYLFTTWMDYGSADDWIRLLDKAGCQMFHLHAWWLFRGPYDVNPYCFPNGMSDIKKLVDRLHAAGKRVSTHSLSAVVQFGSKYVSPEWFDDFIADAGYVLAKPYRRGDAELWVTTRPDKCHARILNGCTNGNILRLGDDLLQYDDFTTEPPYRFTGVHVAREPYGDAQTFDRTQAVGAEFATAEGGTGRTRSLSRAEYPADHAVSYLHHRYAEFLARPGSRLAEELTDRLAEVYNTLELDGIYFDGSEAMPTRYDTDWLRERTISKLKPRNGEIINSASCRNPFNWWHRSLAGTWDHPTFSPRGFNDRHIRVYKEYCRADFMRTDLGWWNTHEGNDRSRGYFPEEQEYVMCKAVANDMTMSLQGPRPSDGPLSFQADAQLTIFGKWMRARYARAFRQELLDRMVTPGEDWQFRQNDSGAWTVAPLECHRHRVATADFASWRVPVKEAGDVALRVEALYSVDRTAKPIRVLDASMLPSLERSARDGVAFDVRAAADPAHGETIRLTAENVSAPAKGSWARIRRTFPMRKPGQFAPVSSLWVKGDGSGAILNVQMQGWSHSENFVHLDFTGWRKVELLLRERDADETDGYEWPYEHQRRLNNPSLYMCPMDGTDIEAVAFYLNGIPKGWRTSVEVGAWDALPQKRGELHDATVSVNGARYAVPFALAGGEYAELADGFWTHISQTGKPLTRIAASSALAVRAGENGLCYDGRAEDGGFGRAEVTLFRAGRPEPAFVALSPDQRKLMNIEYEMPVVMNPAKGLAGDVAVRVRPGERAMVSFEILGPAKNPVFGGRRMEVALRDELDRVASYDGRTWQAIRITPGKCGPDNRTVPAKREVTASGTFAEPLPVLGGGTTRLAVTADEAVGARVTVFKTYCE